MARRFSQIALVAVLVVALCAHASAQSGCTTVIISLAPCLGYISGNSLTPSSSCCTQLASVVQSNPSCLCTVLNGGAPSGITVNQTRALALPGACNVQTPPVSQCNTPPPPSGPSTLPLAPLPMPPLPAFPFSPSPPPPAPAPSATPPPPPPVLNPSPGNGSTASGGAVSAKWNGSLLFLLLSAVIKQSI